MTRAELPDDLAALIEELRGVRDVAATDESLMQLRMRLRSVARRHLPAHSPLRLGIDSEDLVQDSLVQLVREVDRFQGESWPQFLAFVNAMLAQKAAQQARRQRVREPEYGAHTRAEDHEGSAPTPSFDAGNAEDRRRLRLLVEALPDTYKTVMMLRLDGLDSQDIAERLQIEPAAARKRLSRAIKMMQERW